MPTPAEDHAAPTARNETPRLAAISAAITHPGFVRRLNEDAVVDRAEAGLWAVIDGMGGDGRGAEAARIIAARLSALTEAHLSASPDGAVTAALTEANDDVATARGLGQASGATAAVAAQTDSGVLIAWVGDARAYLVRQGRIFPVTRDHSLVQDMVERGEIDPAAASRHPEQHIVTRAIGAAQTLAVEERALTLQGGDRLILCSDGLTRAIHTRRIGEAVAAAGTPADARDALLALALDAGAPDNLSAVVIAFSAA